MLFIRTILKKPLKKPVVLKRRKRSRKFDISKNTILQKILVMEIDFSKHFSHVNTQIQFDRTSVFNTLWISSGFKVITFPRMGAGKGKPRPDQFFPCNFPKGRN